jgi:hypothetical protein
MLPPNVVLFFSIVAIPPVRLCCQLPMQIDYL